MGARSLVDLLVNWSRDFMLATYLIKQHLLSRAALSKICEGSHVGVGDFGEGAEARVVDILFFVQSDIANVRSI